MAAALVFLAGCTADSDTDDTGENGGAPGSMPQVAEEFGGDAQMDFGNGTPAEELHVEVLEAGDGEVVEENAAVLAHYAGHVWDSAEPFDSSFERGEPSMFPLTGVVQGWSQGIPGHSLGSRLLISIPPELGYGSQGNAGAGIGGEDTIVFVVDLIDAVNPDQAGAADAELVADLDELPVSIDGDVGEPAMITVDDDAPVPQEPTIEVIADGGGEVVQPGHSVVVAYSIVTWSNEEQESTWPQYEGTNPVPEMGQVGSGQWHDLLAEVPEGSRVLITLPGGEGGTGAAILADVVLTHGG